MTRQTTRLDCVGIGSFAQGIAHVHRVLADAYIHELGENDSQVGARYRTVDPARYASENIMASVRRE